MGRKVMFLWPDTNLTRCANVIVRVFFLAL